MTPMETYYERTAETVIKGLAKRRMTGYYCPTGAEACELALKLIDGARDKGIRLDGGASGAGVTTVGYGGSMTLGEIGLKDRLRQDPSVVLYDRDLAETQEERDRIFRYNYGADTFLMSTNAITLDGILVNTDGTGNRVAPMIYGPAQVIIIAGMNKVTADLDSARSRTNHVGTPPNCIRLDRKTPCSQTGKCGLCLGDDCICSDIVVTRRQQFPDRVKVILVGESLGY